MKGRRSGMGAELVPLALILGCVVGSLALVVAVHRQKAATPKPAKQAVVVAVAPSPPPAPPAPKPATPARVEEVAAPEPPEPPPPVDPTPSALAKLTSAEAEQLLEASRADRKAASLEVARKSALAESERWRRREALVHAQLDSVDGKVRKMEGEVDALALERDALERERDARKAMAAKARSRPGQAILPHKGPNGTWRRPIVVECTNGMAILQPRGLSFGLLDLAMGFGPSTNPFVATVAREAIRIQGEGSPDGQKVVPYIFFVVRPDGIRPYYEARGRLESLGITFGYELADQDWDIEYPDLDDTSTWDGSAPRMAKVPDRAPDEDALDQVLHPKGGRPEVGGSPATVAAEDQEFPSFSTPRRGTRPPPRADGFAWPASPTPRYVAEAGIAGPDAVRGGSSAGDRVPSKPALPRRPLDRQGRAALDRADGFSTLPPPGTARPGGPAKDPTDLILAGGPPGGLMPVAPDSADEGGSRSKAKGSGSSGDAGTGGGAMPPPTSPSPTRGEGFQTALGGSEPTSSAGSGDDLEAGPTGRNGQGLSLGPIARAGGGSPPSLSRATGGGSPLPPSSATGGAPLPPSPLVGEGRGGGAMDEGSVPDPSQAADDPGNSFIWPTAPKGANKGKARPQALPISDDLEPLPAADGLPQPASSPIVEDLGQVGMPSNDPASSGGSGLPQRGQAGRPVGSSSSNPDQAGGAGAGGSDPARRILAKGNPPNGASGSTPPPPQGLAGLGLGPPDGMTPPQGSPGDDLPTPSAVSPRSRSSSMPELPPGKIHDRTFEIVVVCNPRGVIVQPGGYRVTAGALKDRDGLFKKQIVGLVKGKRMAEPGVVVDPKVRFLVQAGGYETYRTARSQFLLSGLDWPATTQVADPDPLSILPSEGW